MVRTAVAGCGREVGGWAASPLRLLLPWLVVRACYRVAALGRLLGDPRAVSLSRLSVVERVGFFTFGTGPRGEGLARDGTAKCRVTYVGATSSASRRSRARR